MTADKVCSLIITAIPLMGWTALPPMQWAVIQEIH